MVILCNLQIYIKENILSNKRVHTLFIDSLLFSYTKTNANIKLNIFFVILVP